jgi:uncharacterized membrane protein
MRRDWPLVAAGTGLSALSAAVVAIATLAYRATDPPCEPPKPPAVMIDGCQRLPGGFGVWIHTPEVAVLLALAAVLLVAAAATVRHGLSSPPP